MPDAHSSPSSLFPLHPIRPDCGSLRVYNVLSIVLYVSVHQEYTTNAKLPEDKLTVEETCASAEQQQRFRLPEGTTRKRMVHRSFLPGWIGRVRALYRGSARRSNGYSQQSRTERGGPFLVMGQVRIKFAARCERSRGAETRPLRRLSSTSLGTEL